jgi:hypothetical protein
MPTSFPFEFDHGSVSSRFDLKRGPLRYRSLRLLLLDGTTSGDTLAL